MIATPGHPRAEPDMLRPMRFGGQRRYALALEAPAGALYDDVVTQATESNARAGREGAALAYGFVDAGLADRAFDALGWTSLGAAPALVRPLRLSSAAARWMLPPAARALLAKVPLVAPFGRARGAGVREISVKEPRITRLWDRFSIDIGVAVERTASYIDRRVFDRQGAGYRVFILEDGDRYAIRAMCVFTVRQEGRDRHGYVMELLHDRSVTGMRAASHLLGLALREMLDADADAAFAWSLPHSGSFPIYARHAFLSRPQRLGARELRFGVRAFDPELHELVTQRERWYVSYLDLDPP